jgi:diguanylate cyclase with GGDEF domain
VQQRALVMVDLDHFKEINDRYGLAVGDGVLSSTARCLLAHVRVYDRVYCYGGEEFLVSMPQATVDVALDAAERLRDAVAEQVIDSGAAVPAIRVTASFGVAALEPGSPCRGIDRSSRQGPLPGEGRRAQPCPRGLAVDPNRRLRVASPHRPAGKRVCTGRGRESAKRVVFLCRRCCAMATTKQVQAAKRNVKRAQAAATRKRTIAHLPERTRQGLVEQAVSGRGRGGAPGRALEDRNRQQLYEIAGKEGIPGRSKMGKWDLINAIRRSRG